ncbi:MAG TPA: fenitrothion hydrolase [Solirubrobacteraceae bacterium]|nr:fenitrothion hydrolase [Solirubrobacteraceae bacterium]
MRVFRPLLVALAALALAPAAACAHGLAGRAFLPVPAWLFAWAAGAVLIASFLALGSLWSSPRLEHRPLHRLCGFPRWFPALTGAIGVGLFLLVALAGIAGSQIPSLNLAPTAVFVLFWVGLPVLSALLGDVFALLSPWAAIGRLAGRLQRSPRPPLPYPPRLGRWPAVAGILAFAWLELVFAGRQHPATLAVLMVGYALVQLVGIARYGVEAWTAGGDAFAVAFGLFGAIAPLRVRRDGLYRATPLAGLTELTHVPGTVALLAAMIGTTTFDGFLNGPVWRSVAPGIVRDLGGSTAALELTQTAGMALCILICGGLYWLGVRGMSAVSQRRDSRTLARAFAHTLAPIAFGYLLAHYFSLLITQGQATAFLVSDPLGTGANLFGTAGSRIDFGLVSAAVIWYVQVAALLFGHVGGLALAHDRALVVYAGDQRAAAESQRWMLVVMVTFTCLGLWLLSAVNT